MVIVNKRRFEYVPLFIIMPEKTVHHERSLAASFLDIRPSAIAASGITDSIRSYGVNLLSVPMADKNVPYRLGIYSRKSLFDQIARSRR
jgi:hypothetical protein